MADKPEKKEGVFKRQELAGAVVEKTGLPRAKAVAAVDAVLETITERLKESQDVRLVGFGVFGLSTRKAGKGRDPRSGAEIDIAEATTVRFRPSKALRDAVSGSAAPPAGGGRRGGGSGGEDPSEHAEEEGDED